MFRLIGLAGPRWQLSHAMGLAAVLLFAAAYVWHVNVLIRLGWRRIGIALAVTATPAFGLFAVALAIDGFVVPATAGSQSATLEQIAASHRLALFFFTPGVFLMFVTMGLLSSPMLHRAIHSRWLGVAGQIVAIAAVTAYFTGVTGPDWNNLQIAGTLMMAAFAWHLLVGVRALRDRRRVSNA